jgi:AcrR family transcriptional regulator
MKERDHRIDVAAQRRARMRLVLLSAGMAAMADQGIAATSIDDVIRQAGVARGSFYKYFGSVEELAAAIGLALVEEVVLGFEQDLMKIVDPAERLAAGLRSVFSLVDRYPVVGRFIVRAGWPTSVSVTMLLDKIVATVDEGIRTERFANVPEPVISALVGGVVIGILHEMLRDEVKGDLAADAIRVILAGLGLDAAEAHGLATRRDATATIHKGPLLAKLTE